MRLGVIVRNSGPGAVRAVTEVPSLAESLGFDSVWVSDHVIVPESFAERYDGSWLEATVALTTAALATSRIALGFSALVLPYRAAALAATQVASIESLAPGRLVVGAGCGWLRAEFEALGADFARRGAATDEGIKAIRAACGAEILAAGNNPAALRRAQELCHGWHPIALAPDEIAAHNFPKRIVLRARFSIQDDRDRPLFGTPKKIRDDITAYEDAGVDEIVLDYPQRDHDDIVKQIHRFAEEVLR